jgi:outer membrane protein OmpA-like peptidoglycan-associated protein
MKTLSLVPIAALVLFQSVASHAAGISQMEYRYSFDGAARDGAHVQTFVICDDACTAESPLAAAPRFPALSVRVSRDIAKENAQKGPVSGSEGTSPKKDASEREPAAEERITVLFGLDGSALTEPEKARLSSFVENLAAETKTGDLFVTGYTCDLGSKAHNDVLAIKRGEAVAAYLRKSGLHAMRVTGTGKCCYAAKDPGKRYLNRRVEVTISKREVAK